jgi:hypothetical protein
MKASEGKIGRVFTLTLTSPIEGEENADKAERL